MPQRAVEQHHAARRHGRGNGVIIPAVFRRRIELVAAGDDARRAVVGTEIRQRPDRIQRDRDMRPRQRNQLRVFVDRLRLLARTEHQRAERRQQTSTVLSTRSTTGSTFARQRHFPEDFVIGEKIVDADGLVALERSLGVAEIMLALDPVDGPLESGDKLAACRPFDHGKSILANPLGMRLDGRVRRHSDLPAPPGAVSAPAKQSISRSGFGFGSKILDCGRQGGPAVPSRNSTTRSAVEGISRGEIDPGAFDVGRATAPGSRQAATGSAHARSPIRARWSC